MMESFVLRDITPHHRDTVEAFLRGTDGIVVHVDGAGAPALRSLAGLVLALAPEIPTLAALGLAAGAAVSTAQQRAALVEAINAGRHVELEAELLSYRQHKQAGIKPNRNGIRVRNDGMPALVASKQGNPFLRDHAQYELLARGGTILSTRLEETSDELILRESVRLNEPWAVRGALLGNIDRLSIGMRRIGGVICTICQDAPRRCLWDKGHWPGMRLDDGRWVEWEFESAEGVETSGVNVPAVSGTAVTIKHQAGTAELARAAGETSMEDDDDLEAKYMASLEERTTLAAQLESERSKATALENERDAARAAELAARKELEVLRCQMRDEAAEQFVANLRAGLKERGLELADEWAELLREQHKADPAKAAKLAETVPATAPHLNAAPQRLGAQAKPAAAGGTGRVWTPPHTAAGVIDKAKLEEQLFADPCPVPPSLAAMLRADNDNPLLRDARASLIAMQGDELNALLAKDGYAPIQKELR